MSIKNAWKLDLAIPFQAQQGPVLAYLGPAFYHSEAKRTIGLNEITLNEKNHFDVFGGLRFDLGLVDLELEGQFKSEFSAGALLSFQF